MLDTDPIDQSSGSSLTNQVVVRRRRQPKRQRLQLQEAAGNVSPRTRKAKRLALEVSENALDTTSGWSETRDSGSHRSYVNLVKEWVGKGAQENLAMIVRKRIAQMLRCIDYYGYMDPEADQAGVREAEMRLMCLGDRIVTALGGAIDLKELDGLLFVTSVMLIKMWCDYSCHLIMFEWENCNVLRMARLERKYLTALNFRLHISQRHLYDFGARLEALERNYQ